jgi:hypothetical protein
MCFSAPASFTAGAVLLTIGAISQLKSTTHGQRAVAAIPLLFGAQQLAEGVLWLSFSYDSWKIFEIPAMYLFLIFAQVVWPFYVPISMRAIETNPVLKKWLTYLSVFGGLISFILLIYLFIYPSHANAECYHVFYDVVYPIPPKYGGIFYFTATAVPLFLASSKRIRLLGVILTILYIICKLFYLKYLLSVWCFFAAIASVLILYAIIGMNKKPAH